MKATELRIGNWILLENKHPHQITGDDLYALDDVAHHRGKRIVHSSSPIPLSPEVLEACGFEKVYDSDYRTKFDHIEKSQIGYDFTKKGVDQMMRGFRYYGGYVQHILSLHQLQNLYFALTGEELNYSPKTKNL